MRNRNQFESEAELARIGVEHFRGAGFKVYQEVAYGSRTIDFVAVQGPISWIVEVKKSRTLKVLSQADAWIGFANRVSVLVPQGSRNGAFFNRLAVMLGVGVFEGAKVHDLHGAGKSALYEQTGARLYRKTTGQLRELLYPEQETHCEAGSAGGGRWSPWKDTMTRCVAFVRRNPGCLIGDIMKAERHHYNSDKGARSSISTWLDSGHFPEVETRVEAGRRRFYPKPTGSS